MSEAGHFVAGLNALLFVVLLCTCLFVKYLLKRYRVTMVPDSCASMVIGFLVGYLLHASVTEVPQVGGFVNTFGGGESDYIMFQPEVFFYLILPPIIFHAGFSMEKTHFFSNVTSILLFAVFGTLISTLVIGFGLFSLARMGAVNLDSNKPLECLIFGSLISAVDPVATLSILGGESINTDPLLYSLVFGESVLNDAVSIVLFHTLKEFQDGEIELRLLPAIFRFVSVTFGSLCIAVVVALLCSFLLRNTPDLKHYPHYEFTLVLLFAYGAYCVAEIVGWSGIMALFACGILMSHYAWYNLSEVSQTVTRHAFHSLAMVCETFLFAYLGITAVLTINYHLKWSLALIFATLALCLVSRALNIFPFAALANLGRTKQISANMQFLMWFAGLRGAIAFALSLNVTTAHHSLIVTTTMSIVIVTTLVCGGFTDYMLSALRLKLVRRGEYHRVSTPAPVVEDEHEVPDDARCILWWKRFDQQTMRPLFGGRERPRQEEVELSA